MASQSQPATRVILWAPPRSLSTVFEKCMSFVDGVQIINEPYNMAKLNGPDRIRHNPFIAKWSAFMESAAEEADANDGNGWDDKECTFQWVKNTLETDYPKKKIVFCKDLIPGITGQFNMVPRGYRHTFLIRNPTKVFLSLRKLLIKIFLPPNIPVEKFRLDVALQQDREFDADKVFFGDMLQLIDYLKDQGLEADPIIIDADDLQNHPESIVRQYCEAVGIPYNDNLLKWESGDGVVRKNWLISKSLLQGNKIGSYYDAAFASTGFQPTSEQPPPTELPVDIAILAANAEPFYKVLYERRLKPCQLKSSI